MIKPLYIRILTATFMFAGVSACVYSMTRTDLSRNYSGFLRVPVAAILLLFAISALVASALSWRQYLFALSGHRLGLGGAFYQVGLLLTGKYVPILLGGLIARMTANLKWASPTSVVAATLLEQFGAMAAAAGIGVASITFAYRPLVGVGLLLLVFSAARIAPVVASPLLSMILWLRARVRQDESGEDLRVPERKATEWAWIAQVIQWLFLAGFVASTLHVVAPETSTTHLLELAGLYGIAVVVGIAAFIFPGGIGPREVSFVWLAGHVVGYDIALGMASTLRVAMTGIDLLAGAGCVLHWIAHVSNRSIKAA